MYCRNGLAQSRLFLLRKGCLRNNTLHQENRSTVCKIQKKNWGNYDSHWKIVVFTPKERKSFRIVGPDIVVPTILS